MADGICSVAKRSQDAYTPLLIGELQPWTSLGELGGEITRATFDRYNELNSRRQLGHSRRFQDLVVRCGIYGA